MQKRHSTAPRVERPLRQHLERIYNTLDKHVQAAVAAAGGDVEFAALLMRDSLAKDPEFKREVDAMNRTSETLKVMSLDFVDTLGKP